MTPCPTRERRYLNHHNIHKRILIENIYFVPSNYLEIMIIWRDSILHKIKNKIQLFVQNKSNVPDYIQSNEYHNQRKDMENKFLIANLIPVISQVNQRQQV